MRNAPMYAKNTMAAPAKTPTGEPSGPVWPKAVWPKKEMPKKPLCRREGSTCKRGTREQNTRAGLVSAWALRSLQHAAAPSRRSQRRQIPGVSATPPAHVSREGGDACVSLTKA